MATTLEQSIDGVALSLSLLCTDGRAELLTINRQRVVAAPGELLAYHGVEVRAVALDSPDGRVLARLAQRIAQAVPGLAGYVGVDLVWRAAGGPAQPGGPVVIEINPRLTCAYVGLSVALGRNLAGEILRARRTEAAALPSDTARGDPAVPVIGWDVGGAHVKASLLVDGRVRDVAQWPAPLWQGLTHLDAAIDTARARWPMLDQARHGVTMTAEMTDLFPHREAGVAGLVDRLAARLGPDTRFFAGAADWPTASEASARWRDIASANWLATAHQVGARHRDALLVDIGSTTTDLIPVVDGQPRPQGRSDAARLASGELVYVGVVRTPLCALARQIAFGGRDRNVMNEFFATTADVFRLTGELDTAHDQHPTADGGDRSVAASCRRLARMIGMDSRDAEPGDWLAFAARWREAMLTEIATHLARVARAAQMPADAPLVGAGCGLFLVRELAGRCGRPFVPFHTLADVDVSAAHHATPWADTCAPSVAVALLLARWSQPCG
jgi:probable H4MPT-linked C1 transfer pathway protein